MKFTGGPELSRAILALPLELRRPVLVKALKASGAQMRDRMAAGAPRGDEAPHIADNIGMSEVTSFEGVRLSESEAAIAIGPTRGFFYGFFWEFGTFKLGKRPFMRPAFDGDVQGALISFAAYVWAILKQARASSPGGTGGV